MSRSYWCEATATTADRSRVWRLGAYRAHTPRLAIRWLRNRGSHIASVLDPENDIRHWLHDAQAQERQMQELKAGRAIVISDGCKDRIAGGTAFEISYHLIARPSE